MATEILERELSALASLVVSPEDDPEGARAVLLSRKDAQVIQHLISAATLQGPGLGDLVERLGRLHRICREVAGGEG